MATNRICTFPGCDNEIKARSLCGLHYRLWWQANMAKLCAVAHCGKPLYSKGLCRNHYNRKMRHGSELSGGTATGDPEKFLRDVALKYEGYDCLEWPYARNSSGYGNLKQNGRVMTVTRIICEVVYGPAPLAYGALHSCGNGHLGCCNPKHLRWGTVQENSDDMVAHGNSARGEKQPHAKLNEAQVREIRALQGIMKQSEIAKLFGVSDSRISLIQSRTDWGWLD